MRTTQPARRRPRPASDEEDGAIQPARQRPRPASDEEDGETSPNSDVDMPALVSDDDIPWPGLLPRESFVAIETNYTDETREEDRNDFWLGRIMQVDYDTRQVQIKYYHTGTKDNLTRAKRAKYVAWAGAIPVDWVDTKRVLMTFPALTPKGRHIKFTMLKRIKAEIERRRDRSSTSEEQSQVLSANHRLQALHHLQDANNVDGAYDP